MHKKSFRWFISKGGLLPLAKLSLLMGYFITGIWQNIFS